MNHTHTQPNAIRNSLMHCAAWLAAITLLITLPSCGFRHSGKVPTLSAQQKTTRIQLQTNKPYHPFTKRLSNALRTSGWQIVTHAPDTLIQFSAPIMTQTALDNHDTSHQSRPYRFTYTLALTIHPAHGQIKRLTLTSQRNLTLKTNQATSAYPITDYLKNTMMDDIIQQMQQMITLISGV